MLPSSIRVNPQTASVRGRGGHGHEIYTGPVDAYLDYRYDHLPYRSLRFEHEYLPDAQRYEEAGMLNHPNDHAYTRITEFKPVTGQPHAGPSIMRE